MIREITEVDVQAVTDICNHYVLHSTASFETTPLTTDSMRLRLHQMQAQQLPTLLTADDRTGQVLGYAYVHPWKFLAAYEPTLEVTIYLHPSATGRGLGAPLIEELLRRTRALGRYRSVIACITGGNLPSIRLFSRLGFKQVSEFKAVGRKFNLPLDVVDLQLPL